MIPDPAPEAARLLSPRKGAPPLSIDLGIVGYGRCVRIPTVPAGAGRRYFLAIIDPATLSEGQRRIYRDAAEETRRSFRDLWRKGGLSGRYGMDGDSLADADAVSLATAHAADAVTLYGDQKGIYPHHPSWWERVSGCPRGLPLRPLAELTGRFAGRHFSGGGRRQAGRVWLGWHHHPQQFHQRAPIILYRRLGLRRTSEGLAAFLGHILLPLHWR